MKSAAVQNPRFKTLHINGRLISLRSPAVMGILNITPDSFYGASRLSTETEILESAEKMLAEGATFLDVGGYSSRPGAQNISVQEEADRVTFAVEAIIRRFPTAILSVDTFRAEVARQAVDSGASIINDISAGELDREMFKTVAALKVPYIAMHMRGTPQTMNGETQYQNLLGEITDYFTAKLDALTQLGVNDVLIDPGFGFAKTIDQNFELLSQLHYFKNLDRIILVGLSRKSMIWKTLNTTPEHALTGTTALNMVALTNGANILRVHDVKEAAETIKLFSKL